MTDSHHQLDLKGIKAWAYHGVFDFERREGQPFEVDVTWWMDLDPAALADDLTLTVDYGAVGQEVVEALNGEPVNLIETLAKRIADTLLSRFGFEALQVRVHKPGAPLEQDLADVMVTTPVMRASREVVFSLGSNLEPRWDFLQFALAALISTPGVQEVRGSPVYQTAPQTSVPQPDFLNAVVLARSSLPASVLLRRAHHIEATAHRTREIHHGPRTLDVDLIAVGDETWNTAELHLPHPRAADRAFVLAPWLDLDPDAQLGPDMVADLLATLTDQGVRRLPTPVFTP